KGQEFKLVRVGPSLVQLNRALGQIEVKHFRSQSGLGQSRGSYRIPIWSYYDSKVQSPCSVRINLGFVPILESQMQGSCPLLGWDPGLGQGVVRVLVRSSRSEAGSQIKKTLTHGSKSLVDLDGFGGVVFGWGLALGVIQGV
uniref:Uncharacterized protein n=1 Tax=Cannabis sativa TaxID=3483 RepID=A0A803QRK6_CANSA